MLDEPEDAVARPRRWTPERVASKLERAFREHVNVSVFSPRANTFVLADGSLGPTPLEIVGLTAEYLKRDGRLRTELLAWARARAGGPSFSDVCRQLGWDERSARRHAKRACKLLAFYFNEDGIPVTLSRAEESALTLSEAA